MATKVQTLPSFYRGETIAVGFKFTSPYTGFNWSTVNIGCAMTEDVAPNSNSTADAVRTAQLLTVDPTDNSAMYVFQLTITESNSLTSGSTYKIQAKITQSGSYVIKPITASVKVLQDYDI